jgi:hypothetical protein
LKLETLDDFNFYSKHPFERFAQKISDKSRRCTELVSNLAEKTRRRSSFLNGWGMKMDSKSGIEKSVDQNAVKK